MLAVLRWLRRRRMVRGEAAEQAALRANNLWASGLRVTRRTRRDLRGGRAVIPLRPPHGKPAIRSPEPEGEEPAAS